MTVYIILWLIGNCLAIIWLIVETKWFGVQNGIDYGRFLCCAESSTSLTLGMGRTLMIKSQVSALL